MSFLILTREEEELSIEDNLHRLGIKNIRAGKIRASIEEKEGVGIPVEPEEEVTDDMKSATPEELTAELISFAKKELSGEERMWVRKVSRLFWGGKGVERWLMPPDIRLKMEKAELQTKKNLNKGRFSAKEISEEDYEAKNKDFEIKLKKIDLKIKTLEDLTK